MARRPGPDGNPRFGLSENIARVGIYSSIRVVRREGRVIRRNIVWLDPNGIAEQVVKSWMSSPGHRENLLDADRVSAAVGLHQKREHIFVTQNFF